MAKQQPKQQKGRRGTTPPAIAKKVPPGNRANRRSNAAKARRDSEDYDRLLELAARAQSSSVPADAAMESDTVGSGRKQMDKPQPAEENYLKNPKFMLTLAGFMLAFLSSSGMLVYNWGVLSNKIDNNADSLTEISTNLDSAKTEITGKLDSAKTELSGKLDTTNEKISNIVERIARVEGNLDLLVSSNGMISQLQSQIASLKADIKSAVVMIESDRTSALASLERRLEKVEDKVNK